VALSRRDNVNVAWQFIARDCASVDPSVGNGVSQARRKRRLRSELLREMTSVLRVADLESRLTHTVPYGRVY